MIQVPHDVAVVGGGIMGCTTALHLARGGMRVALIERGKLCRGASGVNAGTLSLQLVDVPMVPYARRGRELWARAAEWLGADAGFVPKGVITLAFTEDEAEILKVRTAERAAAGAESEIITGDRARAIEPAITEAARLAAYSPLDGLADASRVGLAFAQALRRAGVEVFEDSPVAGIARESAFTVQAAGRALRARRVVLAGGAWLSRMGRWLGRELPLGFYVNQLMVGERMPPRLASTLGVVQRMLTLKQTPAGTFLIGGGWQAEGDPEQGGIGIIPENLVANLRLARFVMPAIGRVRILRTWTGLQDRMPDDRPIVGPFPGVANAFIIGCGMSGFTIGPLLGKLLAQAILGQEPEMALFDPARLLAYPPRALPRDYSARKPL